MVVASMALGLLQDHCGVPGQLLGMVGVAGSVGLLEALLIGSFEELLGFPPTEGVVLRGVADMPDTAVSPLLASIGGELAVEPISPSRQPSLRWISALVLDT